MPTYLSDEEVLEYGGGLEDEGVWEHDIRRRLIAERSRLKKLLARAWCTLSVVAEAAAITGDIDSSVPTI